MRATKKAFMRYNSVMNLDFALFSAINGYAGAHPWARSYAIFFAEPFAYVLFAVFIGFVVFSRKSKLEKFLFLCYSGIAIVLAYVLAVPAFRYFIHRPRPFLSHDVLKLIEETSYSFPSRHATLFFALAFLAYSYNKKLGLVFFVSAIVMGIARVMVGVHYPSDILGGAVLGIFLSWLTLRYIRPFVERLLAPHLNQYLH